ncbi:MAG: B-4DMT family transporter [Mycobacterium sp.]|nr:B-4DMT family transporter [Mycobacterium sp.]
MRSWLVRGLFFAAAMVVVRLFQGALINAFQTQAGLISIVLVLIFMVLVILWGLIDGRTDARENPNPDHRRDLAMIWLVAGLVAGVVGGAVTWLISLFYKNGLYTGGLINEVTTFAAFTALLVFVPGIGAVTIGRWLVDRKADERQSRSGGDEDRADTDVFDAVHEDETPTEGMSPVGDQDRTEEGRGERSEERRGAVATAENERSTEADSSAHREDQTQAARSDERTQAGPTASDTEETRPTRSSGEDQR